jgi:hypothetical protein
VADVRWREVVTGIRKVQFEHLPLKIMMMRIELERARNLQSTAWVDKCSNDLQSFCAKFLPLVQVDIDNVLK